MDIAKIAALKREILALPKAEQEALARELLPDLLLTRLDLAQIDQALSGLSDDGLDTLVERARAQDLPEDAVAAVIAEGLRAARSSGRP
jgi:hypothetical protein